MEKDEEWHRGVRCPERGAEAHRLPSSTSPPPPHSVPSVSIRAAFDSAVSPTDPQTAGARPANKIDWRARISLSALACVIRWDFHSILFFHAFHTYFLLVIVNLTFLMIIFIIFLDICLVRQLYYIYFTVAFNQCKSFQTNTSKVIKKINIT